MTSPHRPQCGFALLCLFAGLPSAAAIADTAPPVIAAAETWPGDAELEAQGARIGSVTISIRPIFDPEKPGERRALYQLADRWHVDTRESAINAQLLFQPGDAFSRRVLDETERNLRDLRFIREPEIRIVGYHDGLVDLEVVTQDIWTTNPGVSFGRAGGKNSASFQLEELNLLGFGKQVAIDYSHDVDRNSYTLAWQDPNVGGSRWRNEMSLTDSNDGSGGTFELERPFFSLDTRWSAGLALVRDDAIHDVYRLGHRVAEYRRDVQDFEIRYGWSKGLQDGWTYRWNLGLRRQATQFAEVPGAAAPESLPADRDLNYPFLRLEAIEDDFETSRNLDQIGRTEDLQFGKRFLVELGWASAAFGSDRDAAILRASASRGYRLDGGQLLFLGGSIASRLEGGSPENALLSGRMRYYRQTSPRSTFYTSLAGDLGGISTPTANSCWEVKKDCAAIRYATRPEMAGRC